MPLDDDSGYVACNGITLTNSVIGGVTVCFHGSTAIANITEVRGGLEIKPAPCTGHAETLTFLSVQAAEHYALALAHEAVAEAERSGYVA